MYLQGMKQVYPRYKRSRPLPFPLEDCSFPRSGLSSLGLTVQPRPTASARQLSDLGWQSRSRKRKVLSRKRKLGLDLFLSGIYLFPALQNIYSYCLALCAPAAALQCVLWGLCVRPWTQKKSHDDADRKQSFEKAFRDAFIAHSQPIS